MLPALPFARETRVHALAVVASLSENIARQLLIPMALAGGGTFRSLKPTAHTVTNADVIRRFLDVTIAVELESEGIYRVRVGSAVKENAS